MVWNDENLIKIIKGGGVVVMPTDTLYGIVGQANNESVVNKIYAIRKRDVNKPCIILIEDIGNLERLGIFLTENQKSVIEKNNEPTSFILDCPDESLTYLHRGTNSLAFRVPREQALRDLITKTGPLIAPSANIEDFPPAQTISEAKKYFDNLVDLYVDGGTLSGKASRIIKLQSDGRFSTIRE
ncbi:threonylcarbamoyl-AMP synthase [Candidatus Nomurabacteria bacterium RIFCSPLOWO2_02_40_28]|uniref:L-threonylcarbamoyladenylate synthase n=2 Tax=Candidatus Nomuraibacteriota TaxID=1752729 RepID=A0A837I1T8_9BACT|nr:MAG: Sua5/YciO/YrdC/YwlC family protein [Candidatus Nomurabacteria bacterium GW2011_GWD2_39_12]KKR20647.1 MAG: Sua5/YciO/YrdC/YwlC family protein [Candidatus Nomurabacteria bacterium GW2011_GWC2_39_41]KKR37424.1 MAG: Sua5/YciO/YrdC/YwlC family protein [Candidatus Nomurabacteria bacterium GW2011_GWE2_40_10]KKR38672.1 MAG: Sua5/YciO/YrdC/YwlC family protein [Candidatus Nomurabacteria bacterium GW2011_GWB1_40_11]KKR40397.1 MAG: Sua5/YciO/YrdC/YwlC family protein [Parcubacteria group bacterium G